MPLELRIVTPDNQTRRLQVGEKSISLGRSHDNDLCYPEDASLSRRHLVLRAENDGYWAEDMGSKNGTLLNGVRLTAAKRFRPGDRLVAGHLEITLADSDTDSAVVFVPGSESEPSGTVMTRLSDLLSNDATEPLIRTSKPPPVTGEVPALEAARGQAFDSPVVRVLLRAGRELGSNRPLEDLFPLILEMSIEAVGAERGILMLLEGGQLITKAAHGDSFRISATVRDQVLKDKSSLLVRDVQQEEALREQLSISAQQIHTMMAVPLQTEDSVIGLIYVDSRLWMQEFTPDDLNLLTFLGNVAANRIEQERMAQMERENQQAAVIQRTILPGDAPKIPGVDLAGHNAPCRTVGGDYYDFITYDDGRVAVVLADVAGKGMSAALMMSNLQPRVQMLAERPPDLGDFMSRLDKSLVSSCPSNRFITLFMCLLDPTTGAMSFCNAGHNPPLLVRLSGKVDKLLAAGTVLGILPELGYSEQSEQLEPGELLAIFSDGVTEAVGTNGEEYGEDRLGRLLVEKRDGDACTIIEDVLASVEEWTGGAPAEDDVTLVVVRRVG